MTEEILFGDRIEEWMAGELTDNSYDFSLNQEFKDALNLGSVTLVKILTRDPEWLAGRIVELVRKSFVEPISYNFELKNIAYDYTKYANFIRNPL